MVRALEPVQDAGPGFQANSSQARCPSSLYSSTSQSVSIYQILDEQGSGLLEIFGLITCHRPAQVTGSSELKAAAVPGACYLLVCRTPHQAEARSPRDSCRYAWSLRGLCSTGHSHHFHLHRSAAESCLRTGEDNLRGLCKAGRQATVVVIFVPLEYGAELWTIEAELASPALWPGLEG